MDIEISAQLRSGTGKGFARGLRRQELVPAVLYGPKMDVTSLSVPARRLEKLLRDMGEEQKLLRLTIEGVENSMKQVLIQEVQVHPIKRRFLHVDFYEVPLDHPIVVEVPIELLGEAIGVKKGGTIDLIRRTVSVRCLPGNIPERIQVDVSELDLGDSIHVGELAGQVPFELVDEKSQSLVTIPALETAKEAEGEGE